MKRALKYNKATQSWNYIYLLPCLYFNVYNKNQNLTYIYIYSYWSSFGITGQWSVNGEDHTQFCKTDNNNAIKKNSSPKPEHINIMKMLPLALVESEIILHKLYGMWSFQDHSKEHEVNIR